MGVEFNCVAATQGAQHVMHLILINRDTTISLYGGFWCGFQKTELWGRSDVVCFAWEQIAV